MLTYTIILSIVMMAGLFLMLWSAVGFIQNKRFFTSAPKAAQEVIKPKDERFNGQHAIGWLMMILALVLMGGRLLRAHMTVFRRILDSGSSSSDLP
ncbi:MAG: hypothetical protein Q4D94_11625 [Bacillota bacterium]|nr:hypothetical protein [Bacillota bacterium]